LLIADFIVGHVNRISKKNARDAMKTLKHRGAKYVRVILSTDIEVVRIALNLRILRIVKNSTISSPSFLRSFLVLIAPHV